MVVWPVGWLFGFGRPAGEAVGVSPRLGLGLFAPGNPALKHWAMFFGPAGAWAWVDDSGPVRTMWPNPSLALWARWARFGIGCMGEEWWDIHDRYLSRMDAGILSLP